MWVCVCGEGKFEQEGCYFYIFKRKKRSIKSAGQHSLYGGVFNSPRIQNYLLIYIEIKNCVTCFSFSLFGMADYSKNYLEVKVITILLCRPIFRFCFFVITCWVCFYVHNTQTHQRKYVLIPVCVSNMSN